MGFQESLWKGMTIELRAEFCPPPPKSGSRVYRIEGTASTKVLRQSVPGGCWDPKDHGV